jgi:hypothetical protein
MWLVESDFAVPQRKSLERARDEKSTLPTLLRPHGTPYPDGTAIPGGPRLRKESAFTDP